MQNMFAEVISGSISLSLELPHFCDLVRGMLLVCCSQFRAKSGQRPRIIDNS